MSRSKKLRKANEKQIFIFSEWDTEICYFNQLKSFLKAKNIKILWKMWQISWINLNKILLQKNSL